MIEKMIIDNPTLCQMICSFVGASGADFTILASIILNEIRPKNIANRPSSFAEAASWATVVLNRIENSF